MINFDGNIVESVDPDTVVASGIEYVPRRGSQNSDKLYGSIDPWYGVVDRTHPTIWFSNMTGGVAVDTEGRRVFMIEKGFGGHQNENTAVVHVWVIS